MSYCHAYDRLILSARFLSLCSEFQCLSVVDKCYSCYSFKELAETRPLSELRSAEESATVTVASDASETAPSESDGKADEGKSQADGTSEPSKLETAGSTDPEELKKYIGIREALYIKAKEFESKIIGFEMAIRRPYFHVRPLNVAELENWHSYLDFIESDGDFNKVLGCLTLFYVKIQVLLQIKSYLCNIIDLQLSSIWCIICFIGFPLDQASF